MWRLDRPTMFEMKATVAQALRRHLGPRGYTVRGEVRFKDPDLRARQCGVDLIVLDGGGTPRLAIEVAKSARPTRQASHIRHITGLPVLQIDGPAALHSEVYLQAVDRLLSA